VVVGAREKEEETKLALKLMESKEGVKVGGCHSLAARGTSLLVTLLRSERTCKEQVESFKHVQTEHQVPHEMNWGRRMRRGSQDNEERLRYCYLLRRRGKDAWGEDAYGFGRWIGGCRSQCLCECSTNDKQIDFNLLHFL